MHLHANVDKYGACLDYLDNQKRSVGLRHLPILEMLTKQTSGSIFLKLIGHPTVVKLSKSKSIFSRTRRSGQIIKIEM